MRITGQNALWVMAFCAAGLGLTGCEESNNGLQDREIYIGNDVTYQLVFPAQADTVVYRDSTSGFTAWVEDGRLNLRDVDIVHDSIMHHGVKHYFSMKLSFRDTYVEEEAGGVREIGTRADGTLMWSTQANDTERVPLEATDASGRIEGSKLRLYSTFEPGRENPYVVIRTVCERIR